MPDRGSSLSLYSSHSFNIVYQGEGLGEVLHQFDDCFSKQYYLEKQNFCYK